MSHALSCDCSNLSEVCDHAHISHTFETHMQTILHRILCMHEPLARRIICMHEPLTYSNVVVFHAHISFFIHDTKGGLDVGGRGDDSLCRNKTLHNGFGFVFITEILLVEGSARLLVPF